MNWTTPTRHPRAQPRAITPKAADDFPLPCPVLSRTTESARVTAARLQQLRSAPMAFEDYVRDEIVADCAEGYLTRRQALRRLMLLGVGATTAAMLLAGCGDDKSSKETGGSASSTGPSSSTSATTAAKPVGPAPLATEAVTFAGPAGQVKGSWSAAPTPKG